MTYDDWFNQRKVLGTADAQSAYFDVTGEDLGEQKYSGVIEFPDAWLFVTEDDRFHAIAGQGDIITPSLDTAARYLWENHAKHETQA